MALIHSPFFTCLILQHHCTLLKSILVTKLCDTAIEFKKTKLKKHTTLKLIKYRKNMLFTTEDRILIKHYRLDKNMAVGQYA